MLVGASEMATAKLTSAAACRLPAGLIIKIRRERRALIRLLCVGGADDDEAFHRQTSGYWLYCMGIISYYSTRVTLSWPQEVLFHASSPVIVALALVMMSTL